MTPMQYLYSISGQNTGQHTQDGVKHDILQSKGINSTEVEPTKTSKI